MIDGIHCTPPIKISNFILSKVIYGTYTRRASNFIPKRNMLPYSFNSINYLIPLLIL